MGVICGSAQLVRPPPNAEAQASIATLTTSFVAPWARGHGLARMLTEKVEQAAAADGYEVLQLDVRETQLAAIQLYRKMGFTPVGVYHEQGMLDGRWVDVLIMERLL